MESITNNTVSQYSGVDNEAGLTAKKAQDQGVEET